MNDNQEGIGFFSKGIQSRKVTAPWLTYQAARDGSRTAVFTATARDRTGLLFFMANLIHRLDPRLCIHGGAARVFEDYFTASLLLYLPAITLDDIEADIDRLNRIVEQINAFKDPPISGWQIPITQSLSMVLSGSDRQGLLAATCAVFQQNRIHVASFEGRCEVDLDSLPGEAGEMATQPSCKLSFSLELPSQAQQNMDQVRDALLELGLMEVKPKG